MNDNKIKVLNLYAGIGGNRKLWQNVEVTAVEINPEIAAIYQNFFPNDTVIVADAHKFLLEHYTEYDFIWSSPVCKTHSNCNHFLNAQGCVRYPEMTLYQEIILLKTWFKGTWVVENVISYYEPLIKPFQCERHYFWCNFVISKRKKDTTFTITNSRASTRRTIESYLSSLQKYHNIDLSYYDASTSKKIEYLANCVRPELGNHVFKCAFKEKQTKLVG